MIQNVDYILYILIFERFIRLYSMSYSRYLIENRRQPCSSQTFTFQWNYLQGKKFNYETDR